MRFAFCLFKYFDYGGLARDCMSIARACVRRGHQVTVYAMEWQGAIPPDITVKMLPAKHWQNHRRTKIYVEKLNRALLTAEFDLVIGFNKMRGLDVYYAADPCYQEKAAGWARLFYRLGGRYRYYAWCEEAVFSRASKTVSLMLSSVQMRLFEQHYQTPSERMLLLPPGIAKDRIAADNAPQLRADFRATQSIADTQKVLLMLGSAFKTKGLDRTLKALSLLPVKIQKNIVLWVVGEGDSAPFQKLARKLGVQAKVIFFGGRKDVPLFLLSADLLVHPAYSETAGIAIIEAIVAGLPVVVSDVCGYAFHVELAGAGKVLASPFNSQQFASTIEAMLDSPARPQWISNAHAYAKSADLYSMPERAVAYLEQIANSKMSSHVS